MHLITVANPGKMKGGVQTNQRPAQVMKVARSAKFLGLRPLFRSHVTRENPMLSQGSPIIDLRIAVNQLAQANLNTPLAVDTSKQQIQSLNQIIIATKTDKQLVSLSLLKLTSKGGVKGPHGPPSGSATAFHNNSYIIQPACMYKKVGATMLQIQNTRGATSPRYIYIPEPHHVIVMRRRTSIRISPRAPPTTIPLIWLVVRIVVDFVGSFTLATLKPRAACSSRCSYRGGRFRNSPTHNYQQQLNCRKDRETLTSTAITNALPLMVPPSKRAYKLKLTLEFPVLVMSAMQRLSAVRVFLLRQECVRVCVCVCMCVECGRRRV